MKLVGYRDGFISFFLPNLCMSVCARTCMRVCVGLRVLQVRKRTQALKAVYGPLHQIPAPLRSSDGSTLLTDKKAIPQRGQSISKTTVQES